jgi:hypothetical protein
MNRPIQSCFNCSAIKFCPKNRCFLLTEQEYQDRKVSTRRDFDSEDESDESPEQSNEIVDACVVLMFEKNFKEMRTPLALISDIDPYTKNTKYIKDFLHCLIEGTKYHNIRLKHVYNAPGHLNEQTEVSSHSYTLQWKSKKVVSTEELELVNNPESCYLLCLQRHNQNSTVCRAFQACSTQRHAHFKYSCSFLSIDPTSLVQSSKSSDPTRSMVQDNRCSIYRVNTEKQFAQVNQVTILSGIDPIQVDHSIDSSSVCAERCWSGLDNRCRSFVTQIESPEVKSPTVNSIQKQTCRYYDRDLWDGSFSKNIEIKLGTDDNSVAFTSNVFAFTLLSIRSFLSRSPSTYN